MYEQFIEADQIKLKAVKKNLNFIRAIRMLLFLLVGYSIYNLFDSEINAFTISLAIISVLFFSFLVNVSQRISKKSKLLESEILFIERERSKTSKQFHSNGNLYIDQKHDYTFDLDVFGQDSIFHSINRTHSIIAERQLANYFKQPDLSKILIRQESIQELSENITFRKRLYAIGLLNTFNADAESKLYRWLNKKRTPLGSFYKYIIVINPIIIVLSLIGVLISTNEIYDEVLKYTALLNLFILGINFKKLKSEIFSGDVLHSNLFMLSETLKLIEKTSFEAEELNNLKSKLLCNRSYSSDKIEQLARIYQNIYNVQNLLSAVLFNALFLQHIRSLIELDRWMNKHSNDLPRLLNVIAEIEAISSLANFKYNHPNFTFADITEQKMLEMQDIGHPLIEEEEIVLNSISFKESEFKILTGSNMSGKSTFLRSIGINILLANMGSVCFAKKIKYKPIKLITSMRNNDSVLSKESYFMAEVNRLKYVFESIKTENVFLLLDEILKGTNSDDKLEGSKLILQKLIALNQQGIIATHDLELCNLEKEHPNQIQNICFESEIVNNMIHFDYKLNVGICKNKSASYLIQKNILN